MLDNADNIPKVDVTIEDRIRACFAPPISHLSSSDKCVLQNESIKDLELSESCEPEGIPLMDYVFPSSSAAGKIVRPDMIKLFTTNTKFIRDTQKVLKSMELVGSADSTDSVDSKDVNKALQVWSDLKMQKDFKDKYHYIDWERFTFLNQNDIFLQVLSMYNLAAPVMALLVPVVMLLVPFFVIQSKGVSMTFSNYLDIFKDVVKKHAIGKIFTSFGDVSWNERIYMLISVGVYVLSLYQNTQICTKFYNNMYKIHDILFTLSTFIKNTVEKMHLFIDQTAKCKTYRKFVNVVKEKILVLTSIHVTIDQIKPFSMSYKKLSDMGVVLKMFYDLYDNRVTDDAMSFAFGFTGYLSNMQDIKRNIQTRVMGYGNVLSGKSGKSGKSVNTIIELEDVIYPPLIHSSPVKNDILLDKDCIITGPNASGKTTILKSVLLNILFTQQYGCGFYSKCTITPYHYLHCYLNVPDTSGRDSLFQSESRKCKKILEKIEKMGVEKRHFCLFDELYSGTNPIEAVTCGHAYLAHLGEMSNIQYMLTTHYKDLCEKLKDKDMSNMYKMDVLVDTSATNSATNSATKSLTYTYRIEHGINEVDGGVEVLRKMNYPSSILEKIDNAR